MLWEVEIRPLGRDGERDRVVGEFNLLTHSSRGSDMVSASARGYLLEGKLDRAGAEQLRTRLLEDSIVESARVEEIGSTALADSGDGCTVLLKPGVMDPTAESVLEAAADLGIPVDAVRTFRRYFGCARSAGPDRDLLFRRVLANDAIEQIVVGPLQADHLAIGKPYVFRLNHIPIRRLTDDQLVALSREGGLALSLDEMRTVQERYRELDREPTDIELESIAQTWSEHCSHKTLKGTIDYYETVDGNTVRRRFANLLKETIFGSTQRLREQFGGNDWCVSVFADNAGVVTFNERYHVCFKVETHNHPSAIEPYGGANTGLGGVIRDPMGTGLGAKPICNTDVFCFAPPDYPPEQLPAGVLHPRRTMIGVVSGVKDYGNRMGIPTVNGTVVFDERYLANPLVFCGTVGLIPVGMTEKAAQPGDHIVAVGGRTGRDGIHGATFSSLELTDESETVSGGAVQIGNAITEKKVLDVVLQARDRGLYHAITDCGAGGFSSAVGEMGADLGAVVRLDQAPLKYAGLSYTEIWISESQERMVLAVPPNRWKELESLCRSEGVEAAIIGTFEATGKLRLTYEGNDVGEVDMHFLHDGRPNVVRRAEYTSPYPRGFSAGSPITPDDALKRILGNYSVCSKEWIVRQYDHEVQGGSVVKPLTGVANDGPSDASVVLPVLDSFRGLAVGCGLNPRYGDLDPYWMAASAVDEALRNVVAVGADPLRTAILDNFCWGNVNDPVVLGSLVRTAEACRDAALAYGTPFVSGKDSLNNEYRSADRRISIPGTLLISALGQVPDVRRCVTMDFKAPGNDVLLIGTTLPELGGSHYALVTGGTGGFVPRVDFGRAPHYLAALHQAICRGLIRSCHDLSEGGLAVALAESAFAGGVGVDVTMLQNVGPGLDETAMLFSESNTRFLVEVEPSKSAELIALFEGLSCVRIGRTVKEPRLRVAGLNGEWAFWLPLAELKEAWQQPLRW